MDCFGGGIMDFVGGFLNEFAEGGSGLSGSRGGSFEFAFGICCSDLMGEGMLRFEFERMLGARRSAEL